MTKVFDNIVGLRDMTADEQAQYDKDLADWMDSYKHFGMDMNSSTRGEIHFSNIGTNYKFKN